MKILTLNTILLTGFLSFVACNNQTPPGVIITVGATNATGTVTVSTSPLTLHANTPGFASGSVEFFEGTKSLGVKTEVVPSDQPVYSLEIPITKADNGQHTYTAVLKAKYSTGDSVITSISQPVIVTINL